MRAALMSYRKSEIDTMPVTVVVGPDPGGHRFEHVRYVAEAVRRGGGELLLLTIRGARETDAFASCLADVNIAVHECFDQVRPPVSQVAAAAVAACQQHDVDRLLFLEADQLLTRWWLDAPPRFRRLSRRPRIAFLLMRYPTRLSVTDWKGWAHRVSKTAFVAAASRRGVLDHTVSLTWRGDRKAGWRIGRVRDPAICAAHSSGRLQHRSELDLPPHRRLVGVFGRISEGKNVPLVYEAATAVGDDVDLVLGGALSAEVRAWLETVPPEQRSRLHVRDRYLANDEIDRLVAAVDVVAVVQGNNAPSGIMGKALVAQVPVLSAGSVVRRNELAVTRGGISVDLTPAGVRGGLATLLADHTRSAGQPASVPVAAAHVGPEQFTDALLNDPGSSPL